MTKRTLLLLTLLVLAGCGGKLLTGAEAIPARELPSADNVWENGKVRFADLKGEVVLVEAWSPS